MDKQELTDLFRDAIDSAHDYDSTASDFAKACVATLEKNGLVVLTGAEAGRVPDRESAWLIERKVQPPQYATDKSSLPDWKADPWRAARFTTEREAFDTRLRLTTMRDECHVTEHIFINKP